MGRDFYGNERELKMNASDFKKNLSPMIVELDDMSKHDFSQLTLNEEWSMIDDIQQHLKFLRDQLQGLSDAAQDKFSKP